jgi:membrane-associated phospholipid phosphatase
MQSIFEWGTRVVLAVQGVGTWALVPMKLFSFLGTEEFFLVLITLLYWCVSAPLGIRLTFALLAADTTSGLLKLAFHTPRPFWTEARVEVRAVETSYGMPSGHALIASTVWPYLAYRLRRAWVWVAAIVLVLLISLSRMYLGVHFPQDVITGWLFGALLLALYIWAERTIAPGLAKASLARQVLVAVAASALVLLLSALAFMAIANVVDPPAWMEALRRVLPPDDFVLPRDPSGLISDAGLILGMGIGLALAQRSARFEAGGALWKRALRYLIGLVGVLLFWRGLTFVFPGGMDGLGMMLRYVRYALTGLWAVYLAPLVFLKLKLAERAS